MKKKNQSRNRVWKFGKIYYYIKNNSLYIFLFVYGFSFSSFSFFPPDDRLPVALQRDLIDDESRVWGDRLFCVSRSAQLNSS